MATKAQSSLIIKGRRKRTATNVENIKHFTAKSNSEMEPRNKKKKKRKKNNQLNAQKTQKKKGPRKNPVLAQKKAAPTSKSGHSSVQSSSSSEEDVPSSNEEEDSSSGNDSSGSNGRLPDIADMQIGSMKLELKQWGDKLHESFRRKTLRIHWEDLLRTVRSLHAGNKSKKSTKRRLEKKAKAVVEEEEQVVEIEVEEEEPEPLRTGARSLALRIHMYDVTKESHKPFKTKDFSYQLDMTIDETGLNDVSTSANVRNILVHANKEGLFQPAPVANPMDSDGGTLHNNNPGKTQQVSLYVLDYSKGANKNTMVDESLESPSRWNTALDACVESTADGEVAVLNVGFWWTPPASASTRSSGSSRRKALQKISHFRVEVKFQLREGTVYSTNDGPSFEGSGNTIYVSSQNITSFFSNDSYKYDNSLDTLQIDPRTIDTEIMNGIDNIDFGDMFNRQVLPGVHEAARTNNNCVTSNDSRMFVYTEKSKSVLVKPLKEPKVVDGLLMEMNIVGEKEKKTSAWKKTYDEEISLVKLSFVINLCLGHSSTPFNNGFGYETGYSTTTPTKSPGNVLGANGRISHNDTQTSKTPSAATSRKAQIMAKCEALYHDGDESNEWYHAMNIGHCQHLQMVLSRLEAATQIFIDRGDCPTNIWTAGVLAAVGGPPKRNRYAESWSAIPPAPSPGSSSAGSSSESGFGNMSLEQMMQYQMVQMMMQKQQQQQQQKQQQQQQQHGMFQHVSLFLSLFTLFFDLSVCYLTLCFYLKNNNSYSTPQHSHPPPQQQQQHQLSQGQVTQAKKLVRSAFTHVQTDATLKEGYEKVLSMAFSSINSYRANASCDSKLIEIINCVESSAMENTSSSSSSSSTSGIEEIMNRMCENKPGLVAMCNDLKLLLLQYMQ